MKTWNTARWGTAAATSLALVTLAGCSGSSNPSGSGSASSAIKVNVIDVSKGGQQPAGGKPVDTVNWALTGDIQRLDPTVAYDFSTVPVVAQGCEALLRFDATGKLIPNLASDWSSTDPTTYVYNLRSDVTFWDGSPMTADDVVWSLNHYLDPKAGAYMAAYYANVASITKTGPSQVTVKLKQPDTQWKYAVAMTGSGAIMEKKYGEAHASTLGDPTTLNMCTGPFKFVSWTKGQQIVLVRNDNYWNKDRTPKVKNFIFKIIPDESTVVAALNKGEVDGGPLYTMDGRLAASLDGPLNLISSQWAAYNALYFNNTRKPWTDQRVREAMALALNRPGIAAAVYNGLGDLIKSPIPPIMWTYEEQTFKQAYDALPAYAQNVDQAKQLIQQAGATGASSTLMTDPGTNPKTALFVQQAGQAIGLNIQIKTVPFTQKTSLEYADGPKEYDMDLLTWVADTPDPLSNIALEYNSANTVTNIASYKNATVDQELIAAQQAKDDAEEAQHVIAAQAQIMKDVPMVPVIAPDALVPLNKRLTGFDASFFSYWDSFAADLSGTE